MKYMKKKLETTNSTMGQEVAIESPFVEPLKLNIDLGRQDLNEAFQKVESKINEIIRKKMV